jgi:hypothetical protein
MGYITDPMLKIAHVIINYIPNLFSILVIVLLTRYLLKVVRFFFKEVGLGNIVIESNVPVVCQHSRLDSRQVANALLATIAYSED